MNIVCVNLFQALHRKMKSERDSEDWSSQAVNRQSAEGLFQAFQVCSPREEWVWSAYMY